MNKKKRILLSTVLVIAIAIATYLTISATGDSKEENHSQTADSEQIWTCSMHPQIRLPKKGLCPICNMDLIPLKQEQDANPNLPITTLSQNALALMDVEVMPVERRAIEVKINVLGKVDYDETRLSYITAWNAGRLEKLFVDYTGISIQKDEPMVEIYSPQLILAQEEYLEAIKTAKQYQTESSKSLQQAAKEKLSLLGLTDLQIEKIKKSGKPTDLTTIYAPAGGVVIAKQATEGMYVKEGTKIYTLADLSKVWIILDAYESDLPLIKVGQSAEFTTTAKPGFIFKGKVSFIDPFIDTTTQTARVRLQADNPDQFLKPGMFVKASIRSSINVGSELPLVIPASAALITGKRAVVYVRTASSDKWKFEGREVVLGSKAGDYYEVRSGLKEGELVAVRGAFKIDSSLQISAKPSMMSQSEAENNPLHHNAKISIQFKTKLKDLFDSYFALQSNLAADNFNEAKDNIEKISKLVNSVSTKPDYEQVRNKWQELEEKIENAVRDADNIQEIKTLREAFRNLSEAFEKTAQYFGSPYDFQIYVVHCPMAFDNSGANWLSLEKQVQNPYFGAMMLKCGDIIEQIPQNPIWDNE